MSGRVSGCLRHQLFVSTSGSTCTCFLPPALLVPRYRYLHQGGYLYTESHRGLTRFFNIVRPLISASILSRNSLQRDTASIGTYLTCTLRP